MSPALRWAAGCWQQQRHQAAGAHQQPELAAPAGHPAAEPWLRRWVGACAVCAVLPASAVPQRACDVNTLHEAHARWRAQHLRGCTLHTSVALSPANHLCRGSQRGGSIARWAPRGGGRQGWRAASVCLPQRRPGGGIQGTPRRWLLLRCFYCCRLTLPNCCRLLLAAVLAVG